MHITKDRKYFSLSGSLVLALLVLSTQTECRPSTDEGDDLLTPGGAHADNVEIHHVKLVDGVMHEDHPIVMYKEDFVSEDYDPNKQETELYKKYKFIKRQHNRNEKYNVLKPEKMYFDILPKTPIVKFDEIIKDTKFDTSDISAELVPLIPEVENTEEQSKQGLSKHPKKYNSRQRRDLAATSNIEHKIHKRHPHYRSQAAYPYQQTAYYPQNIAPAYGQLPGVYLVRHPVQGKPPKNIDIGNRFSNGETVNWGIKDTALPPSVPDLWHDSDPQKNDFSQYTTPGPATAQSNSRPNINRPPFGAPVAASVETLPQQSTFKPVINSGRGKDPKVYFPAEFSPNSKCIQAEQFCCIGNNISEMYNCFRMLNCNYSIPDIANTCD